MTPEINPPPTMNDPTPIEVASGAGPHRPTPPQAIGDATPTCDPSAGAGGATDQPAPDQRRRESQRSTVEGGSFAPPPAHDQFAGVAQDARVAARVEEYNLRNLPILCLAENLYDIELARIAMANRLRSLAELDVGQADIPRLEALVAGITDLEHRGTLDLERAMRHHPLAPWIARSRGVGLKQAGRLLATIGNPYWNERHQRPRRGPAELWAYCGFDVRQRTTDPQAASADVTSPGDQGRHGTQCATVAGEAPRRRKGQPSNWNEAARMRTRLIAESCMKSGGEYRDVYDTGRLKYADAVHHAPCHRCGPTGKPAATGTPLSPGHQHARALRLVAKAVLRDLWTEARDWHHATP